MNYHKQLQKVISFIGKHLDEELSLDRLSDISCVSKFHFHRLFTAFTGLSVGQYIKWLRLKRAAHQLIIYQDRSIIEIALNAGFESHEAFTRAFKQVCGMSPSQYRRQQSWACWEQPPYYVRNLGESVMKVEIRNIDKIRLAVVEHRDDPAKLADSVNKLITWSKAQPLNLKPKAGEAFGFGYDDPKITPPAEFRYDLGIKIPAQIKPNGDVVEKIIPAGRYAVAMHKGSHDRLGDTIYPLYQNWLPESGEQLGDFPCIFCFHNFEQDVAETELLTECWVLLK
jgi:AraC family transcriptional regulator